MIEKLEKAYLVGEEMQQICDITNKINEIIEVINDNDKFDEADIIMATYFNNNQDYIKKSDLLEWIEKDDCFIETGLFNADRLIEYFNLK